jgi:hypothetical protein
MKYINIPKIIVYSSSFFTLLGISFLIFGKTGAISSFNIIIILLMYILSSTQYTLNNFNNIRLTENSVNTIDNLLFPELNHSNMKIRQYYRNKKYYKNYIYIYFYIVFLPFFLFLLITQKTKLSKVCFNFFWNNFLVEKYFKLKKNKVIKTECITENNKEYEVKSFIDGKKEYRYKNKLHRELDHAIFYEGEFCASKNYIEGKYYIHGKIIQYNELLKELSKHKFNNF